MGTTATPLASGLAAQKDDRHLKGLWREYLKALRKHSVARERHERALRAAHREMHSEVEAVDTRVEVARNRPYPKPRTPDVRVEGVELTEEQLESVRGLVSVMLRSDDRRQADVADWAKQEKDRLWDEADNRHNVKALDEQQDRLYEALESIEQQILDAKAHTVEGAAIKLSLAALRARDGCVAEKEVLAGYEALLEVAGLDDLAVDARHANRTAGEHETLSPYLVG